MDRRERYDDQVEALRAAMDGRLSEVWTALPGIVQAYDTGAMTVKVQPAIRGRIALPDGSEKKVALPLLVDVPVVFPAGGPFTLTYPIAAGDECLVIFSARCIDAWWQSGDISDPLETRMHDLSDGFALVGPFSQARVLPDVSAENVQLRTNDGKASVTMQPDYTIAAANPAASVTLTPGGEVTAQANTRITLRAPDVRIAADGFSLSSLDGGSVAASIVGNINLTGDINQTGAITSTGDHTAEGISLATHLHDGVLAGGENTGEPVK